MCRKNAAHLRRMGKDHLRNVRMFGRFPFWAIKRIVMNKANLFWAIIWTIVFVTCIAGYFWNPAHIFTAIISALFAVLFWYDHRKTKGL